jgi:endonuclease/exonuclease/phosphatase (EEP) superfamily protein YafD
VQGGLTAEPAEGAEARAASPAGSWHALFLALAAAHLLAALALFPLFALRPRTGWVAFLLYAPRVALLLPALITAVALRGRWRILPLLTAAIVLGPLMGLHLNGAGREGEVRLLSSHVGFSGGNPDAVRAMLVEAEPDVVVLEAAGTRLFVALQAAFPRRVWLKASQYVVGSRWPARVLAEGDTFPHGWPAWIRFAIDSPVGTLDLLAVHPQSPRPLLRGSVRRGLRGDRPEMEALERQLRDIDDADRHGGPLRIVAGDFNVPELAGLLRGLFAGTADAFAAAGNGYGYTFPAHGRWIPWMRLDRVLTGPGLRATRAEVIGRRGSDHAALMVDLERASR